MFFDSFPRFYETSEVGATRGRLNLRYEAIFAENADVFAGARVIDIASHDGRWSLAALETGAAEVVGIEARANLVRAANENLAEYVTDAGRYRFVLGDVFEVLREQDFEADVVLCLGFLYHTVRHSELMRRIRDVSPGHLLIDTAVVPGEASRSLELRKEGVDRDAYAVEDPFSHASRTLVGVPSVPALKFLLRAYDFKVERFSDWGAILRDNPDQTGVDHYADGARVTARCISTS